MIIPELKEALQEIADMEPEDFNEPLDEWSEAACFRRCQKVARDALDSVKTS